MITALSLSMITQAICPATSVGAGSDRLAVSAETVSRRAATAPRPGRAPVQIRGSHVQSQRQSRRVDSGFLPETAGRAAVPALRTDPRSSAGSARGADRSLSPRRAAIRDRRPPYNLLCSNLLDFATLRRLERFARYWDLIGNSGRFNHTRPLLLGDDPFGRFPIPVLDRFYFISVGEIGR